MESLSTWGVISILIATVLMSIVGVVLINRHMRKKYAIPAFTPKASVFITPNEARSHLPKFPDPEFFEDFDIDYNQVATRFETPHFCCRHKFTLDSVQMSKNEDEDILMFSCKTDMPLTTGETVRCSASREIERQVFWKGPKKIQEEYVDPAWLQNYENNMYNQNMRAFERSLVIPGYIKRSEPVLPN